MHIQGHENLCQLASEPHRAIKAVFNANGIIFFPVTQEHSNQSGPGISYADNYKGNALAAMVTASRFDIRYHQDYSDKEVTNLVHTLLQL
jgi:hypothetical protein